MGMTPNRIWYRQWLGYCAECDRFFGVQIKEKLDHSPPYSVCPFCSKEDKFIPLIFSGEFDFVVRDPQMWLRFRRFDTRKNPKSRNH